MIVFLPITFFKREQIKKLMLKPNLKQTQSCSRRIKDTNFQKNKTLLSEADNGNMITVSLNYL